MSAYALLKLGHVSCVAVSGALFTYRYLLLNLRRDRPLPRLLKVLPHINDTALLAFAIGMLAMLGLNPFTTPWLLAKFVVLVVYIVLGAICLRSPPGSIRQAIAFGASIAAFTYIVLVALTRQVLPFVA